MEAGGKVKQTEGGHLVLIRIQPYLDYGEQLSRSSDILQQPANIPE